MKKNSKVFLTIPQYANHRGKDQNAVRYAIKTGKITSFKKVKAKGKKNSELMIDRDAADMEWVPRLNPREEVIPEPEKISSTLPTVVMAPPMMNSFEEEEEEELSLMSVAKSRAKKEKYEAELAKIKVEKERGKLIDAKATEEKWIQIASITRTKVLGLPSKARQRMPELTDLQYSILEMIVRETLEELAGENVTTEDS